MRQTSSLAYYPNIRTKCSLRLCFGLMVALLPGFARAQWARTELVGAYGGSCQAAVGKGDKAYISEGIFFTVLDVTNPATPHALSHTRLPAMIEDIKLTGTLACVAAGKAGFYLFDVADPSNPIQRSHFATAGYCLKIALSGHLALLAIDGRVNDINVSSVPILDISDPAHPVKLSAFSDTSLGTISSLAVSGMLAYIGNFLSELWIFDFSDPAHPESIISYPPPYDSIHWIELVYGNTLDITISGNMAYLAQGSWGLAIIDVTNPRAPLQRGIFSSVFYSYSVAVSGTRALLADGGNGLQVIDVSNPDKPVLEAIYPTSYAFSIQLEGERVYVADTNLGLKIIDITQPTMPWLLGAYVRLGSARCIKIYNSLAIVLDWQNSLYVMDVSHSESPVMRGSLSYTGHNRTLVINGNLAYVAANEGGLYIVDFVNPDKPVLRGFYHTPEGFSFTDDVEVSGHYAYVATSRGLELVDVSDPNNPMRKTVMSAFNHLARLETDGSYIYAIDDTDYPGGLYIIDVTDPARPAQRSFLPLDYTRDVCLKGKMAVMYPTMQIVDVSNPTAPVVIGRLDPSAKPLNRRGPLVFVPDQQNSITVMNIAVPSAPTLQNKFHTLGNADDVAILGSYAFVADSVAGLSVFKDVTPNGTCYWMMYE